MRTCLPFCGINVFDITHATHVHWVQYWYYHYTAEMLYLPSPSAISLRVALWVICRVRSTLYCYSTGTLQRYVHVDSADTAILGE